MSVRSDYYLFVSYCLLALAEVCPREFLKNKMKLFNRHTLLPPLNNFAHFHVDRNYFGRLDDIFPQIHPHT